ncbi:MAG: aminotransferase class IV [Eubacteriales bacterium]|nr:aminotransferase class IV [Eubacteriales bacterium]
MIYKNVKILDEKPDLNDNFIYEVLRCEDEVYLFFEDHMKRLYGNLEKANKTELFDRIKEIMSDFKPERNVESVMIMVDGEDVFMEDMIIREVTDFERKHGVEIGLYEFERLNPDRKIYRKEFKKEVQEIMDKKDLFELLLFKGDEVLEGSRSNFYYIRDGKIFEPTKKKTLPGVVKKNFYKMCKEILSLEVEERELSLDELKTIDGALLSGTGMDVVPIKSINGRELSGKDYELSIELAQKFREFIDEYKKEFKEKEIL